MRQTLLGRVLSVAALCLLASPLILLGQDSIAPSGVRVGIMLDSPKVRIRNLLPQLRERAKKIATDKKRNITAVILVADGGPHCNTQKPQIAITSCR